MKGMRAIALPEEENGGGGIDFGGIRKRGESTLLCSWKRKRRGKVHLCEE